MSAVKVFSYRAVGPDGAVTSGSMPGEGKQQVALALQKKGLTPLAVTLGDVPARAAKQPKTAKTDDWSAAAGSTGSSRSLAKKLAETSFSFSSGKKASAKDLMFFAENLAMLLSSGISLDKSLAIIAELTESGNFHDVVEDVHSRIRDGEALGDALAQHSKTFPPVFISMVTAGERGGILESVLDKLREYLKSVQEIREFVVGAMIYPAILGLTATVSIVVLLTVVMPRFAGIFEDLGAEVPLPAQVMLFLGDFLATYWWMLLAGAGLMVFGFLYYIRTPGGRRALDGFKLSAPLIGPIYSRIEIGRFARTLGTLLSNGVPILSSLNIVRGVVQNTVFRAHLDGTLQKVKEGGELSASLAEADYIPTLAVHMTRVGEQTGRLDSMLNKVAEVFDKDLKTAIKSFTSVFEPAIILVLGVVIGVMVVSILSAIFSINELGP